MKGYIEGKTIILLENLPDILQDGDEVDVSITPISTVIRRFFDEKF